VSGLVYYFVLFFFFFQAEDGIRDRTVTGVQTCALPISRPSCLRRGRRGSRRPRRPRDRGEWLEHRRRPEGNGSPRWEARRGTMEIGRASCRERVEIAVVDG